MLKSFARWILFRGPARRLLSRRLLRPARESLHKPSLYGMNYGGGNVVEESGDLWVLEWPHRRHAASRPASPAVIFDVGAHDGSDS
jgi:hypothetical protein